MSTEIKKGSIFDDEQLLMKLSTITRGNLREKRDEIRAVLIKSAIEKIGKDIDFSVEYLKNKIEETFKCTIKSDEIIITLDRLKGEQKITFDRNKNTYRYTQDIPIKTFNEIFAPIWDEFISTRRNKFEKEYEKENFIISENEKNIFYNILLKIIQNISTKELIQNLPEEIHNLDYNDLIQEELCNFKKDNTNIDYAQIAQSFNNYLKTGKKIQEYIGNLYQNLIYVHIFFREQDLVLKKDFYDHIDFLLLDTSFLVPLLCDSDPLHRMSRSLIEYCNEFHIKLYYSSKTKFELEKVIEIAEKASKRPKAFYSNQIIQDFLIKSERSQITWNEYMTLNLNLWEDDLKSRFYISLLPHENEIKVDIKLYESIKNSLPVFDFSRKIYNKQSVKHPELRLKRAIEHDAYCIALVGVYRKSVQHNCDKIGPWFISYDNLLSAYNYAYIRNDAKIGDKLGYVMQPRTILSYFMGYSKIECNISDKERVGNTLLQYITRRGFSMKYDEFLKLYKEFFPVEKEIHGDKKTKLMSTFKKIPLEDKIEKPVTSEVERDLIKLGEMLTSTPTLKDFLLDYYNEFTSQIIQLEKERDEIQKKLSELRKIMTQNIAEKNQIIKEKDESIKDKEQTIKDKDLLIQQLKEDNTDIKKSLLEKSGEILKLQEELRIKEQRIIEKDTEIKQTNGQASRKKWKP